MYHSIIIFISKGSFVALIGQQVSVAQWVGTAAVDADILGLNLDVYMVFSVFLSK